MVDTTNRRRERFRLTAGDAIWVAAAMLHAESPDQSEFIVTQIVERAVREALTDVDRGTLEQHAYQHCVANLPPQGPRLRILFETSPGRRRLFRRGDRTDPGREGPERRGNRITPSVDGLPLQYRPLIDWYESVYSRQQSPNANNGDPILRLRGLGREIWGDEHPDAYVARQRAGWP